MQHTLARLRRDALALALLALLALAFGGLAYRAPAAAFGADTPELALPRSGFYATEQQADPPRRYRWTAGAATLDLPNPGGAPVLRLSLAAGPGRSIPLQIGTDTHRLEISLQPDLRVYSVVLPPQLGETIRLRLDAPTIADPAAPRVLGVVVGDVSLSGGGVPPPQVLLALLLGALACYTLARFAGGAPLACAGAGTLLAGLAALWLAGPGWHSGAATLVVLAFYGLPGLAALGWRLAEGTIPQLAAPEAPRRRWWLARGDWLALAGLVLTDLLYLGRSLALGAPPLPYDLLARIAPWRERAPTPHNSMMGDVLFQYLPWRSLYRTALSQGELPLWNPYSFGGMPLLANHQSQVLYPPNLLFLLGSLETGLLLFLLAHLLIAGLGMYALLRCLRLRPVAGLCGAVVWSCSGFATVWLLWLSIPATLAWLPWILLATERLIATGDRRAFGGLALAVGMTLLGGHVQFAYYGLLTAGLFALWRAAAADAPLHIRAARLAGWLAGVALGGLIAAAQLGPTLELAAQNSRGSTPPAELIRVTMPAFHLATLALPDLFGDVRSYAGPGNYVEYTGYIGLVSLVLIGAALATASRRDSQRWLWLVLAAGALHLAYGGALNWLLVHLPGYTSFRGLQRFHSIWSLGAAGLAAYGLEAALATMGRRRRLLGALAGALLAAAAALLPGADRLAQQMHLGWHGPATTALSPALAEQIQHAAALLGGLGLLLALILTARQQPARSLAAAAVVALVAADLIGFGRGYLPAAQAGGYTTTPGIAYLQAHKEEGRIIRFGRTIYGQPLPPNATLIYGLEDVQGYDSFTLDQHNRLIGLIEPQRYAEARIFNALGNLEQAESLRSPLLDLLGVAFVLADGPLLEEKLPAGGRWERVYQGDDMTIYRNRTALPLAFVVGGTDTPANLDAALARLSAPDFDPARQATLAGAPPLPIDPQATGEARVIRRTLNSLELSVDVRAAEGQAGLLVIRQNAYPGWSALVDGASAPLLTANTALQGLALTAGRHTVQLRFAPSHFGALASVSLLALAVALAALGGWTPGRATTRAPAPRH
ncbi:MAG TPA: YfhO family protein [Roseiflexaceae bacterium]|nr:YfhO family protein [Roseiflexaceae bacterium]